MATLNTQSPKAAPTVLVMGAGPAGALAAIQLARRGFKVKLVEKQKADEIGKLGPRTYNMTLMTRALLAIEKAGVTIPDTILCTRPLAKFQTADGKVAGRPSSGKGITRPQLSTALLKHCQENYPDSISVTYGTILKEVDLEGKKAVLQSESGEGPDTEVEYDLLIGADGARSQVRAAMRDQVPGFTFDLEYNGSEYKTLNVPQGILHTQLGSDDVGKLGLVVFMAASKNRSVIGSVDSEGTWRGVYIARKGELETLESEADYDADVKKNFPQLCEAVHKSFVSQLVLGPLSAGPIMVRPSQLHGPGVLLLGDAAHCVWPTSGQGCNSALEDTAVLAEVLDQCSNDLSKVPEAYNAARYPDVQALYNLVAYSGYNISKNKKWVTARWLICMKVGMMLHRALPSLISPPASILLGNDIPYRKIWRLQSQQYWAMGVFATAATVSVALAGAKLFGAI